MRQHKILHIITGLNDGGAEGALYRLCLEDTECAHFVISLMDGGKYKTLLEKCNVPVYCIEMHRGGASIKGLWRLWRLIRQINPNVVQTWLYHADLLGGAVARLAGVSGIFWGIRHNSLHPDAIKRSTIFVAKLCAFLSPWLPTRIVCCSYNAVREHVAFGYLAEKIRVIPNGYDLSSLMPNPESRSRIRQSLGVDGKLVLFGMVARFDPQKDHRNLISALSALKSSGYEFMCVLAGTGMDGNNPVLREWLLSAGVLDRIILLGQRNDIAAIMNAIDIHLLSSMSEAFPNVLAEAMACGTPCVATNVGDAKFIIGETGWIVPPMDSERFSLAIIDALSALNDTEGWRKRQLAARLRVEQEFTIDRIVSMYKETWLEGVR